MAHKGYSGRNMNVHLKSYVTFEIATKGDWLLAKGYSEVFNYATRKQGAEPQT